MVARLVAEGVVDPAEVVEVDEERGDQRPLAVGLVQRVGQPLLVGEPVGQAGEAVVVGQAPHLLQHPGVRQRDRGLVRQPADLNPGIGIGRLRRGGPPRAMTPTSWFWNRSGSTKNALRPSSASGAR